MGLKDIALALDAVLTLSIHNKAMKKVLNKVAKEDIEINSKEFRIYIVYIYNYIDF